METELQSKSEQKRSSLQIIGEKILLFLGLRKSPETKESPERQKMEKNNEVNQHICQEALQDTKEEGNILQTKNQESVVKKSSENVEKETENRHTEVDGQTSHTNDAMKVVKSQQQIQEKCVSLIETLKQHGILKNDEDWNDVDFKARLQVYVVNKCMSFWNRQYPNEAINLQDNSLDEFWNLIHSGFIGIGNREKVDEWFLETAKELNWEIQTMEWMQDPKKYLTKTKVDIKNQWDKRIEKILRNVLNEWQSSHYESIIQSLHKQIEKLKDEKEALNAEVTTVNDEKDLLQTKLQETEKIIQRQNEEIERKGNQLSEANKISEELSDELLETKRKLNELQAQYEQLVGVYEEQSKMINEISETHKQWSDRFFMDLDEINFELNELAQKVIHANPDSSIYKNLLERVAVNYEMTKQKIIELKDQPDWKDGKVDVKEMINRIQPILQEGMKRNGWINILTYLNCYGDVSQVATEFNSHNLHVLQLGKLNSLIRALLGMVQISIFIPRLLIDEFNTDYYEFKNSETWIDKFCPAICPRDYAGKVFDLIQMGYQIQGKELISYKPLVVYF